MNANTNAKRAAIEATINPATEPSVMRVPLGMLKLEFAHGREIEVDAGKLSPEIIGQAIMHGLKQKLVDAAAIARDTDTGRAATIETKYAAVAEVAERLANGEWNKRREGGGATGGLLKRALVEMYSGRKTAEQIEEYLAGKSDKDKAALRKNPRVAEIIERLRREDAERSGKPLGDDLLAELEEVTE